MCLPVFNILENIVVHQPPFLGGTRFVSRSVDFLWCAKASVLRKGNWKYIAPQANKKPDWLKNKKIETGLGQVPQLYNLINDPAEQHNLAAAEIIRIKAVNGTRIGHPKQ